MTNEHAIDLAGRLPVHCDEYDEADIHAAHELVTELLHRIGKEESAVRAGELSLIGRAHAEAASSDHAMSTRALFDELANEIERLTRERAGVVLVSREDLEDWERAIVMLHEVYGTQAYRLKSIRAALAANRGEKK